MLQADGGTRTTAITGASLALAIACENSLGRKNIRSPGFYFSLCPLSGVRPVAPVDMRTFSGNCFIVATLAFSYVEGRFYVPVFLLLVALAVLPSEWSVVQALKGRFSILVGVLAVLLLSCIGYPSQSGFKPKSGRSQAWDALRYTNDNGKSLRYEAQKEFIRIFRDAPGIVLSDIDPPYLNALLPKPFVAAPIDGNHYYSYSRLWHYGKPEAAQLVANGLGRATPVYALLLPSKDVDQDIKRLPLIQGYTWKRSEKSNVRAVIMTLTTDASLRVGTRVLLTGVVTNEAICRYPLLQ